MLTGATGLFCTIFSYNSLAGIPIEKWTQTSGAQVYLVQSPGIPMVDVQIDFDAGSRRDPADKAGLAGVTASMTGKGVLAGRLTGQASAEPALEPPAG